MGEEAEAGNEDPSERAVPGNANCQLCECRSPFLALPPTFLCECVNLIAPSPFPGPLHPLPQAVPVTLPPGQRPNPNWQLAGHPRHLDFSSFP
jgi:hypothetical protein